AAVLELNGSSARGANFCPFRSGEVDSEMLLRLAVERMGANAVGARDLRAADRQRKYRFHEETSRFRLMAGLAVPGLIIEVAAWLPGRMDELGREDLSIADDFVLRDPLLDDDPEGDAVRSPALEGIGPPDGEELAE